MSSKRYGSENIILGNISNGIHTKRPPNEVIKLLKSLDVSREVAYKLICVIAMELQEYDTPYALGVSVKDQWDFVE